MEAGLEILQSEASHDPSAVLRLVHQAPLLAYNHFVEAVFALNECRASLHAAGPFDDAHLHVAPGANGGPSLAGPAARAKRDTIYTCGPLCGSRGLACRPALWL